MRHPFFPRMQHISVFEVFTPLGNSKKKLRRCANGFACGLFVSRPTGLYHWGVDIYSPTDFSRVNCLDCKNSDVFVELQILFDSCETDDDIDDLFPKGYYSKEYVR